MLINAGTQERLIAEQTAGAGTTVREGSIRSDSVLVSLWVNTVTSGTLQISVVTLTDEGKEVGIISFPVLSAPTVSLLLKKSAVSLQRFKVTASYTGVADYEVYVRAVAGGESSARILGSSNWKVSQVTVDAVTPIILIPSSLNDRQGVLVKNWALTQTVFIAESLVSATTSIGYPLSPRDALALDIAAGASVYAVADANGADVRLVEAGG